MKNVTNFFAATFVIGMFCTINLVAQVSEKAVSPVKGVGVVIKHGGASRVTFCWSLDENATENYRLKIWQLSKGQTPETAMRSNPPIVTKDVDNIVSSATAAKHAINTKGAGSGDRSSIPETDPEVLRSCVESIGSADGSAARSLKTRTKSNQTNERATGNVAGITAVTVDGFTFCAAGGTCDFAGTVELSGSGAKTAALSAISSIPFQFSIGTDGNVTVKNQQ